MDKGLCSRCKYKSFDSMSLCHHRVVAEVYSEIQGDDPFASNFTEARVRNTVGKRLGLSFAPSSWAVTVCNGFDAGVDEGVT